MDGIETKEFFPKNKPSYVEITSDKFKNTFVVQKANNGYPFFEVKMKKGPTAKPLAGQFTGLQKGVDAVIAYIKAAKKSPSKAVEDRYAAKSNSKG